MLVWLLAGMACAVASSAPGATQSNSDAASAQAPVVSPAGVTEGAARVKATVKRVVDGDTIEVLIEGATYKVRYIGINTPETVAPRKPVECFGKEASNRNKELVGGKVVELEKDVSETDRFGRLLRYVYVGGRMVNDVLVREGYAQVATYPPDVKYTELLLVAQSEAREVGRGLWGACVASGGSSMTPKSTAFVSLAGALSAVAPPGTIEGVVVNLTPGGGSVEGAPVTLHVVRGGSEVEKREARADRSGNFQFAGLDTAAGYSYVVSTRYKGVLYSKSVPLEGGAAKAPVQLAVYETTDEDPGIRIDNASLIIAGVDEQEQMIIAMEVVNLVNPADRTYIPSVGGPRGPMGLVRLSLPPGASDLTLHQGIDEAEVIQVDRGFALMSPLPPGSRELIFAYRFPYQERDVSFSKSFSMAAGEFLVLAKKGGFTVASPQLLSRGIATIGDNEYTRSYVKELPAGSTVEIQLKGLRAPGNLERTVSSVPAPAWGGAAVMVAVGIALYFVSRYNPRRMADVSGGMESLETESGGVTQRLLIEMAHLDTLYEAGKISEDVYISERDALKERIKAILRGEDEEEAASDAADEGGRRG